MKTRFLTGLILAGAVLAGCQDERFRSQQLGAVDYDMAWQTAREVFTGYYIIQSADKQKGRIESRPAPAADGTGSLLSRSDAREVAVLQLRREGPIVWADVRVDLERQVGQTYREVTGMGSRRDVPSHTPAEEDAALTPEQNLAWQVVGHNYEKERSILSDLAARLQPATAEP